MLHWKANWPWEGYALEGSSLRHTKLKSSGSSPSLDQEFSVSTGVSKWEKPKRTKGKWASLAPTLAPLKWNAICSLYPGKGTRKTMPGPYPETAGMQSVSSGLSSLQQPSSEPSLFYSVWPAFVECLVDTPRSAGKDPIRLSLQGSVQSHTGDKNTPLKSPVEF